MSPANGFTLHIFIRKPHLTKSHHHTHNLKLWLSSFVWAAIFKTKINDRKIRFVQFELNNL